MNNSYANFFVLLLLSIQVSFAQQTPIDFSDSSNTFNSFGGSTFIILDGPVDSNNDTGQFFRNASPSEQGNYIDLSRPINLNIEDEITLRFYAFDPNAHNVVVKLENGTNSDFEVAVTAPSNQNVWSDLIFDFATVGGSGEYSRLTIRIDDGSTIPGAFRIDDINDGSEPTDPNALDVIYEDLVWADEFDGANGPIDSNNWFHQTQFPQDNSWFNGELQHYTNREDNSFVQDGFLNIVAKRENFFDQGITLQYTSARLNSKFAFTYGRVDVRARLPFGDGTWPAIWTLGQNVNENGAYWDNQGFGTTNWPAAGEIDIMEHGLHAVNEVSAALHTPSSFGNTMNTRTRLLADVVNDFHVYSLNWSPDEIVFLIDGEVFYRYNPTVQDANTWPFDANQYILLNVAMGGFAGNINPTFTESAMVIDYVRVFQNNTLSTDEISISDFKIYPNPTNTIINISSNQVINKLELYSILGNRVSVKTNDVKNLDVSNLQTGTYILKIYLDNGIINRRVVVN